MRCKIFWIFICVILLFSVTGCGDSQSVTSATTVDKTDIIENSTSVQAIASFAQSEQTEATAANALTTLTSESRTTTKITTSHTSEITTYPYSTTISAPTLQSNVAAPCFGLYNAETMECLYSQNAAKRVYPASLTKILTACTALKYVSPDTVFTVGAEQNLVPEGSSLCLIQKGHRLKLCDLLTGMLMFSGNDAAYTIAVNVARETSDDANMSDSEAVAYFADLMNRYARSIGAVNSNFVNPDGWDNKNQYSTVYDLALISAHAIGIEEIRDVVSSSSKRVVFASGETIVWKNTNSLLQRESQYYLPQAIGVKTGTTSKAGKCLIAAVSIDDDEYIAVVMGCESDGARYESVHGLINLIK